MIAREVYELLKRHGHSPQKAQEITLDYLRKDQWAIWWVSVLQKGQTR